MATYPVVSRGIGRKPPSQIRIENDIAFVALTKGFEATIDATDIELIAGYRWIAFINSRSGHAYAARYEKGRCILMHRELLNAPSDKTVDHIDGDGLNNRRANIRLCTHKQNMANQVVHRRCLLGLKGVSISRTGRRFRAAITPDGRKIHLGTYATKEEAAAAYRGAAKVLWGEFARDES